MRYRMAPTYICVSGLRREHDMFKTGKFRFNSRSDTFVCFLLWEMCSSRMCAHVVANPEKKKGHRRTTAMAPELSSTI